MRKKLFLALLAMTACGSVKAAGSDSAAKNASFLASIKNNKKTVVGTIAALSGIGLIADLVLSTKAELAKDSELSTMKAFKKALKSVSIVHNTVRGLMAVMTLGGFGYLVYEVGYEKISERTLQRTLQRKKTTVKNMIARGRENIKYALIKLNSWPYPPRDRRHKQKKKALDLLKKAQKEYIEQHKEYIE